MSELTTQQKDQLKSWSSERDSLLRDISLLRNIKEVLISKSNGEGVSANDILAVLGDIDKLNSEKETLQSDVKELESKKNSLNESLKDKKKIEDNISVLKSQEKDLIKKNSELSTAILTKEEQGKVKTFLEQIADLREIKETLIKENNALSESSSEIKKEFNIISGRIEELKVKEKELSERLTSENSKDLIKKTKLETEISGLEKEIIELKEKKGILVEFISALDKEKSEKETGVKLLEEIIGNVVLISNKNMATLDQQSTVLIDKVKEIISLSTQNIEKHNVVLNKIPELFVELRRKSLERDQIKRTKHTN